MNTTSITYDRYVEPNSFDERGLEDKINDLEKTLNAWQDKYIYLKEYIEAVDQRTKILIREYNQKMALEERDFE